MKEGEMKSIIDFLRSRGVKLVIKGSATYAYKLTRLQHLLFKIGIRALVGVRRSTGYFTAETYVQIPEKSTSGVPCWERIFSPFGFNDYNEALAMSIKQGVEYVKELDKKNHE